MPRTKTQSRTRTTSRRAKGKVKRRRNLDDLGRVDVRGLAQIRQVTELDVAKGIYLGPQAHVTLFQEAERRIHRLRGALSEMAYDRLRIVLHKLRKELSQRVNYFATQGRYGSDVQLVS